MAIVTTTIPYGIPVGKAIYDYVYTPAKAAFDGVDPDFTGVTLTSATASAIKGNPTVLVGGSRSLNLTMSDGSTIEAMDIHTFNGQLIAAINAGLTTTEDTLVRTLDGIGTFGPYTFEYNNGI